jgi:hypothetical protein
MRSQDPRGLDISKNPWHMVFRCTHDQYAKPSSTLKREAGPLEPAMNPLLSPVYIVTIKYCNEEKQIDLHRRISAMVDFVLHAYCHTHRYSFVLCAYCRARFASRARRPRCPRGTSFACAPFAALTHETLAT